MSNASAKPQATGSALRVRDGFNVHPDILRHLATMSADALSGQGTQYRNACRSLSELTRLVGEVLRRARARSQKAAQPSTPLARAVDNERQTP